MTGSGTRRPVVWLVGLAALAILVMALGSILRTARDLESAERRARAVAAHEERVRLALWRMDSALATFMASENVRPAARASGSQAEDPAIVERRFDLDPRDGTYEEVARAVDEAEGASFDGSDEGAEPRLPQGAKGAPDPVQQEILTQQMSNSAEFAQRFDVGHQSLLVPTTPTGPATDARPGLLHALWLEAFDEPETGSDSRSGSRLVLARRFEDEPRIQGLVLDQEALSAWLLGAVDDLLPDARLLPATLPRLESGFRPPPPSGARTGTMHVDPLADPGRRLALLPLVLDPGPPPALADGAVSTTARFGLRLAVVAVVLVVLAGLGATLAALVLARRRTDFASAVIHELRTPLTTFRLYTDMLAEGMVPAAEQRDYARTLRAEADRLGHLVENVLAYARLERQKRATAEIEPVALAPWLHEVVERLKTRAEDEGFTFDCQIEGDLEEVRLEVDPLAVERILHNLCDNSCKYGRGDTARIDLRVRVEPQRRLVVRWRDHGPGIVAAEQRHLFQTFRRGPSATGSAGVGLGLSLSRQLARRCGGTLRTVDVDGPGVALELDVPLAR